MMLMKSRLLQLSAENHMTNLCAQPPPAGPQAGDTVVTETQAVSGLTSSLVFIISPPCARDGVS